MLPYFLGGIKLVKVQQIAAHTEWSLAALLPDTLRVIASGLIGWTYIKLANSPAISMCPYNLPTCRN